MADKTKCFALKRKMDGKEECTALKETFCRENGQMDYSSCNFYKTIEEYNEGQKLYPPQK